MKEEKKGNSGQQAAKDDEKAEDEEEEDDNPRWEWDARVINTLQLKDVVDPQYKTGVTFTKCCHAFHFDCL